MNDKKRLVMTGVFGVLAAIGLGFLIHKQREEIARQRAEADALRKTIAEQREIIKQTPELVKEVIVQRETDTVIKEILSDKEDINNLVRTLHEFGQDSEVTISSLKKQRTPAHRGRGKPDFDKVGYALTFDADAFQLLSFLDRVESHSRLMSVTSFKLTAANRNQYDSEGGPQHRVTLDLETYVYEPTGSAKEVKIDHYDRKRDLLISEISKRADELRIEPYDYKGPQGRRDPWIDPRLPKDGSGPTLTVEEQIALVDALIEKVEQIEAVREEWNDAPNLIAKMKARARLEEMIAQVDEEIRRLTSENALSFVPAQRRFDKHVKGVVDELRGVIKDTTQGQGPSLAEMTQTIEAMERHIERQEYELALEAYAAIEPRLGLAEREDLKRTLVQALRELELLVQTVLEFEAVTLEIKGVALYEDRRPVALINGQAVTEGELVTDEVIVRQIEPDQIEFAFRGLVIARAVEPGPANSKN